MGKSELTNKVKLIARKNGFGLVGVAPSDLQTQDVDFWKQWIGDSLHGEMTYLENPKRQSIRDWFAQAQSVLVVGLLYKGTRREELNPDFALAKTSSGSSPDFFVPSFPRRRESRHRWELDPREACPRENGGGGDDANAKSGLKLSSKNNQNIVRIASYATYKDYHRIIYKRLKKTMQEIKTLEPKTQGKIFVDANPVLERSYAQLAAIGWIGKNTMIISAGGGSAFGGNKPRGSYFFLGGIALNLDLEKDQEEAAASLCGTCRACIEACPTQCLEPYKIDATRCLSYITIEKKTLDVEKTIKEKMDEWVFGCDICQAVCPYNRKANNATEADEAKDDPLTLPSPSQPKADLPLAERGEGLGEGEQKNSSLLEGQETLTKGSGAKEENKDWESIIPKTLDLKTIFSWDEKDYKEYFRGTPALRAKWPVFLRSAVILASNLKDPSLIPYLENLVKNCREPELQAFIEETRAKLSQSSQKPSACFEEASL